MSYVTLLIAPALLEVWSYLASIPPGVWAAVVGIISSAGVGVWWVVSGSSPAEKVRQLRAAADVIDALAVRPLEAIAPMTPTAADDKALLYLRELVVAMREAAQAAEGYRLPAEHIPAPSAVAANVAVSFGPPLSATS